MSSVRPRGEGPTNLSRRPVSLAAGMSRLFVPQLSASSARERMSRSEPLPGGPRRSSSSNPPRRSPPPEP
uniref:Uncharacterized protein n=1 Tax=Arundo donax TaxID=35708 RepID=A0A0A9CUY5_ARUDO